MNWKEIIEKHSAPIDNNDCKLRTINNDAFLEVFQKRIEHNRTEFDQNRFLAKKVDINDDNFLILYYDNANYKENYKQAKFDTIVTYVYWHSIRALKFWQ